MIQKPGIIQLSWTGNALYAQGAFPQVGIDTTDTYEVADQAQTALLASRDPVINEVSVGMSGAESEESRVSGATPLALTGAINAPLNYCLVDIEPEQDLHGYQYPWPGGGGKNKLENSATSQTVSGVTFTVNADGTVSALGISDSNGTLIFTSVSTLQPETEYILSGCPAGGGTNFKIIALINGNTVIQDIGATSTFTTPSTISSFSCYITFISGVDLSGKVFTPMIRLSTVSDATYEPYANICPITGHSSASVYIEPTYDPTAAPKATASLEHTVYVGNADLVSGYGEDQYGIKTYTGAAAENWIKAGSLFIISVSDMKIGNYQNGYCDIFKVLQNDGDTAHGVRIGANDARLFVYNTGFASVADFKTFLAGNNMTVVYPLNIPVPYTFTGVQIIPPAGDSVAWTDCGTLIDIVYTKQP